MIESLFYHNIQVILYSAFMSIHSIIRIRPFHRFYRSKTATAGLWQLCIPSCVRCSLSVNCLLHCQRRVFRPVLLTYRTSILRLQHRKDMQFPLLDVLVKDYVVHRLLEPAAPALVVDEVQIRMEMHGAASRVGDIPWLVQQRASPGGSQ